MRRLTFVAAGLAVGVLAGCGSSANSAAPASSASASGSASSSASITVFAAASLQGSFTEIGKQFQQLILATR